MRKACLLALAILPLFISSCRDDGNRPFHIGILAGLGPGVPAYQGFVDGLEESGYVDGADFRYSLRTPRYDLEEHRLIIEEFVNDKVDLIFVYPTDSARIAKEIAEEKGIPVVFAISYTENYGLIDSVEQPGKGITGVRYPGTEVNAKRYELIRSLAPSIRRLAVIYQSDEILVENQLAPIRLMAEEDGLDLIEITAKTPQELFERLGVMAADGDVGFDAILNIPEALTVQTDVKRFLGDFCETYGIPIGGNAYSEDSKYTLFYVGINYYETGRQAASLAAQIMEGKPAEECPVLSSNQYIAINYTQAEKLNLEIPLPLLLTADEIIRE